MPILTGSTEDLLTAGDLTGFPGAPFADTVVLAVGESIRSAAGWHIAPSVPSTARVRPRGGALFLKTLQLTDVTEIRDVTDAANPVVEDLADWDWVAGGVLERQSWPYGRVYEVDFVHGHTSCPPDLLPAAAFLCQRAKVDASTGAVRLGNLSITPSGPPNTSIAEAAQPDAVVRRYRIPKTR